MSKRATRPYSLSQLELGYKDDPLTTPTHSPEIREESEDPAPSSSFMFEMSAFDMASGSDMFPSGEFNLASDISELTDLAEPSFSTPDFAAKQNTTPQAAQPPQIVQVFPETPESVDMNNVEPLDLDRLENSLTNEDPEDLGESFEYQADEGRKSQKRKAEYSIDGIPELNLFGTPSKSLRTEDDVSVLMPSTPSGGDSPIEFRFDLGDSTPLRSILRTPGLSSKKKNLKFADDHGASLCHIKEIPAREDIFKGAHAHTREEMRTFEAKNERFVHGQPEVQFCKWKVIKVFAPHRKSPQGESQTKLIEERRIRGSLTPVFDFDGQLIDDPALDSQARASLFIRPKIIPLDKESDRLKHKLTTTPAPSSSRILDLPLPGRPKPVVNEQPNHTPPPVIEQLPSQPQQPQIQQQQPVVIQQIYEGTDNAYVAQTPTYSQEETPAAATSAVHIPDGLRAMMERLKNSGIMNAPGQQTEELAGKIKILSNVDVHNIAERSSPPQNFRRGFTPGKINEPCHYFLYRRGGCSRGEHCRFIHDENMKANAQYSRRGDYNGGYNGSRYQDRDGYHRGRGRGRGRGFYGNRGYNESNNGNYNGPYNGTGSERNTYSQIEDEQEEEP